MPPVLCLPWIVAGVWLCAPAGVWAKTTVPWMPPVEFAPGASRGPGLTGDQIRAQLQALLPEAELSPGAPGSAVRNRRGVAQNTPSDVRIHSPGGRPVIALSDTRYLPLAQPFIAVLLDWFEALAVEFNPAALPFLSDKRAANKAARLMRVFASMRMHRDLRGEPGLAPAIGWCRLKLREDWGHGQAGESLTAVLIGTERGWFVVDPFTRRMRELQADDQRWVVEYVEL